MMDRIKQNRAARAAADVAGMVNGLLTPRLLRRRTFAMAFIACVLAVVYWGFLASDRYVSEARVIVQHTDVSGGQSMDFGSILAGMGGGGRSEQLLLRDYLQSVDMLKKLDGKLHLREHYSDPSNDPLSRMWWSDESLERFHRYYLSRVHVDFDDYAGVLVIRAEAYDPETARAIVTMLVDEGEQAMNDMAHQLAQAQVTFLERQVGQLSERAIRARQAVLAFQNENGLVSPQATVESLSAVVSGLEGKLAELRAKRTALLGYLSPKAPGVVEIDMEIDAVEKQIAQERSRLASPNGKTLNRTVEAFQRLQMNAEFTQDVYRTALVALEKGRVEATRMLKKVSVLQSPTLPEYPLEPRRIYNIIVFVLVALLLAGVVHLLAAIIRDHKD